MGGGEVEVIVKIHFERIEPFPRSIKRPPLSLSLSPSLAFLARFNSFRLRMDLLKDKLSPGGDWRRM